MLPYLPHYLHNCILNVLKWFGFLLSYSQSEKSSLLKCKDPKNTTKQLIERMITREGYKMLKNDNLNITFVRLK